MEKKAEILLVDDHALILEGMQRMLELVPGVKVADAVNAVILKSSEAMEIGNAVKSVLAGDSYACPRFKSIRQRLSLSPVQIHPKDIPTKRELDVLKAVARGCNTHEVAAELKISENTVETFRKRLIQKFCAKNAIDMVVKAMAKGWIEIG